MTQFANKLLMAAGSFVSRRLKIVAYHGVVPSDPDTYEVSSACFAEQMSLLSSESYRVLPLAEAIKRLYNGTLKSKSIVITFDDAHASILENAVPVLQLHGFPATIFTPTGCVGKIDTFSGGPKKKPIMDWQQLESLDAAGISIHSHSVSHRDLTSLPLQELNYELRQSLETLKSHFGEKNYYLAYPFGQINDTVREAARTASYSGAVDFGNIISNWRKTDIHQLKREKVLASTTTQEFGRIIDTANDLRRSLRVHPLQQLKRVIRRSGVS